MDAEIERQQTEDTENQAERSTREQARLDPARQEQARRYARLQRRLTFVDLGLGVVYLLAWLVSGWSAALRSALLTYTQNEWLLTAGYVLVFGGLFLLVNLPLSYYEGYLLPKRFGLGTQSRRSWAADLFKLALLSGVLGLIVLEVLYALLRAAPESWWLWMALFLLAFNVLLANLAPVLIFPLFYKFKPLDEQYASLAQRLERLAERAGAPVRGVYQFDMSQKTRAANAALTGLGSTRRIILGDTLLKEFSDDEIEVVMAHELGHQVHRDIPLGIALESVLTLGGLYLVSLGLEAGAAYFGFYGPADIAGLPLLALLLGLYGLVTMPLTNGFSRWRERLADEYALQMTGQREAFISAFTRLANQNLAELEPPAWEEFLLHSHPALSKRIALARQGA